MSTLPRVAEETRERVSREFDDLGPAACAAEISLERFPDWLWTQRGSTPLLHGLLNHWHAVIPVGSEIVAVDGVCTVQLREGLIHENQVFFDRSPLLAALAKSAGQ